MVMIIPLKPLAATLIAFFFPILSYFVITGFFSKWIESYGQTSYLGFFVGLIPCLTGIIIKATVEERFKKLGYNAMFSAFVIFGFMDLIHSPGKLRLESTTLFALFCIIHATNYFIHFLMIAMSKNEQFVENHFIHWLYMLIYILSGVEFIVEGILFPEMKKSYISWFGLIAFGVFTGANVVSFYKLSRENDNSSISFAKRRKTHSILWILTVFAGQLLMLNPVSLVCVSLFGMIFAANLRSNLPNVEAAEVENQLSSVI